MQLESTNTTILNNLRFFKEEYEDLQPEHAIIQVFIDERQQSGLTQKDLSERTGIAQGDISKPERGMTNP